MEQRSQAQRGSVILVFHDLDAGAVADSISAHLRRLGATSQRTDHDQDDSKCSCHHKAESIADNVQRFLMAREPTDRAAKGYSPLLPETDYLARGDKRPQAAPQETCVGRRERSAANTALPGTFGPAAKRWWG
jgi:hypothetical protein